MIGTCLQNHQSYDAFTQRTFPLKKVSYVFEESRFWCLSFPDCFDPCIARLSFIRFGHISLRWDTMKEVLNSLQPFGNESYDILTVQSKPIRSLER